MRKGIGAINTVRNAAKAVKRVVIAKAKGESVMLDEQTVTLRLKACEGCPHLSKARRCLKCNCFVDLKAALATESCPAGKWPITSA